jgi:hypothetical protein
MMRFQKMLPSYFALAAALCVLGCGAATSSERRVLPSFHATELASKRLLIAPYAVQALDPERAVPLEDEDMLALAKHFQDSDPNRAALKAFYVSSAERAKARLVMDHTGAALVEVDPTRWGAYFENQAGFISVSVDGDLRYQVPERALLQTLGTDADFALVLGSLAYTTSITVTNNGSFTSHQHSADFEGKFLVWDYQQARAIAEGKVECSVTIRRDPTAQSLVELGGLVVDEILSKRPFHG